MIALLLACAPPDEVECTPDVGYDSPTDEALAALAAANCARVEAGLEPGSLHPQVDEATQAHADWMLANTTLDHMEVEGTEGFTGAWVWDRLESAGYPLSPGTSWSEVVAEGMGPVGSVELWLNSVYHRVPFTSPGWIAVGFGQAGSYSSMSFVAAYPAGRRVAVLYPPDGAEGVPTRFDSDTEFPDPAPEHGVVGPPITLTVGDEGVGGDEGNLHDLALISSSVEGPDGEVEVLILLPDDDDFLSTTLALVPTAPLVAGAEYSVEMVVEFGGAEETVRGRFTTGE